MSKEEKSMTKWEIGSLGLVKSIALTLLCLSLASYVYANETGEQDTISSQETPVRQPSQEKKSNPLNYAIILISFGSMFLVSSIHYLDSRRKSLVKNIGLATNFRDTTNCVDLAMNINEDIEPMLEILYKIDAFFGSEIASLECKTERSMHLITDVESTLLRRLG